MSFRIPSTTSVAGKIDLVSLAAISQGTARKPILGIGQNPLDHYQATLETNNPVTTQRGTVHASSDQTVSLQVPIAILSMSLFTGCTDSVEMNSMIKGLYIGGGLSLAFVLIWLLSSIRNQPETAAITPKPSGEVLEMEKSKHILNKGLRFEQGLGKEEIQKAIRTIDICLQRIAMRDRGETPPPDSNAPMTSAEVIKLVHTIKKKVESELYKLFCAKMDEYSQVRSQLEEFEGSKRIERVAKSDPYRVADDEQRLKQQASQLEREIEEIQQRLCGNPSQEPPKQVTESFLRDMANLKNTYHMLVEKADDKIIDKNAVTQILTDLGKSIARDEASLRQGTQITHRITPPTSVPGLTEEDKQKIGTDRTVALVTIPPLPQPGGSSVEESRTMALALQLLEITRGKIDLNEMTIPDHDKQKRMFDIMANLEKLRKRHFPSAPKDPEPPKSGADETDFF